MKIFKYVILGSLFFASTAHAQQARTQRPAPTAPLDRTIRPQAKQAAAINLAKPVSFVLENGLKVFVVENNKLPLVSFSMQIDNDPVLEGTRAGLSDMAGGLLGTGTKTKTKEQIDEMVDNMGATLSVSTNGVFAQSLTRHSEALMAILADVMLNAEFRQEEFDRLKTKTLSGLQAEKTNPNSMAANATKILMYGKNHPYGEVTTEETIDKIDLKACFEYYQKQVLPNNAYLAIVGNITAADAEKMVRKYWSDWKKAELVPRKYSTPTPPASNQVTLVPKKGAVQSIINIGYPVVLKPGAPDAIASSVMNNILGGSMNGRLFINLRETRAFTYGAYSSLSTDKIVGQFSCNASVRNNVTDSAVTEFLNELQRMRNSNVAADELQRSKSTLAGNFAFSLEEPRTIANFAINTDKYGLSADYYQNYLRNLSAITVEDVSKVAKKYILPENVHIVVVGDKDLKSKLEPFAADGKVQMMDQYGEPIVELKPAPAGLTANTVLDNYIKAIGGIKNITKIKDITQKMETSLQGMTLAVIVQQKAPDKFLQSLEMNGMSMQKSVYDGKLGKITGMQGNQAIQGDELVEMRINAALFREMQWANLGLKANLKGIDVVNGQDAYVIEYTYPTGKVDTEFYAVNTGLKIRSERIEGKGDEKMMQFTEYADYKAVNGVLFPHSMKQNVGGMELKLDVKSITINNKLKDDIFQ